MVTAIGPRKNRPLEKPPELSARMGLFRVDERQQRRYDPVGRPRSPAVNWYRPRRPGKSVVASAKCRYGAAEHAGARLPARPQASKIWDHPSAQAAG